MNEFIEYLVFNLKRMFRKSTIISFQGFYFISFLLASFGAITDERWFILLGFICLFLTTIYKDFRSGYWKAEKRKEYGMLPHKIIKELKNVETEPSNSGQTAN